MTADRRFSPEETARILQRAVESQPGTSPRLGAGATDGVTVAQLTAAAEEAGISPESVRRAIAEFDAPAALTVSPFYGSPTRIVEERRVERSVPAEEFEAFVDRVRASLGVVGVTTLSPRSVTWSTLPPGASAPQGRRVTVSLRSGPDGSWLRVEEDLTPDVAGYFGLGIGLSAAAGLLAFGWLDGAALKIEYLAVLLPLGAWLGARVLLRRTHTSRHLALEKLATRLASGAEEPLR